MAAGVRLGGAGVGEGGQREYGWAGEGGLSEAGGEDGREMALNVSGGSSQAQGKARGQCAGDRPAAGSLAAAVAGHGRPVAVAEGRQSPPQCPQSPQSPQSRGCLGRSAGAGPTSPQTNALLHTGRPGTLSPQKASCSRHPRGTPAAERAALGPPAAPPPRLLISGMRFVF